jgi:hypothetical protein
MRKILIVRDVWDFGVIQHPDLPRFGIDLSHSLINAYLIDHQRWGMGQLEAGGDYEVFSATVMESVDGFHRLSEAARDLLLYESICYLQSFIDYVDEQLTGKRVDVLPPQRTHRRLMLLVG